MTSAADDTDISFSSDTQQSHDDSYSVRDFESTSGCPADTFSDIRGETPARIQSLREFHQKRYDRFLQSYFGFDRKKRDNCLCDASKMSMRSIKSAMSGKRCNLPVASGDILRHTVVAVEGDACFHRMVLSARTLWGDEGDVPIDQPRSWPNARCIAIHYGLPQSSSGNGERFPRATLLAIMATTPVKAGVPIQVCLRSYERCVDEAAWYEQNFGSRCIENQEPANVAYGQKYFSEWPSNLSYYHSAGARHAGGEPVAGFPFTLLDMKETPELGKGQNGLFAAHPVPYATCFLYSGPTITRKDLEMLQGKSANGTSWPSSLHSADRDDDEVGGGSDYSSLGLPHNFNPNDATYALGLGSHTICFGQGLMRYANHRYNLSKFGNIELSTLVLTIESELSPWSKECSEAKKHQGHPRKWTRRGANRGKERVEMRSSCPNFMMKTEKRFKNSLAMGRRLLLEKESHLVIIPFFIVTTDIEPGHQLLAWSYGDEYDAQLERKVVCEDHLVPYCHAKLLDSRIQLDQRQPYGGHYRYGIGVGDVVWCRRPSLKGARDPVDDLFVVVETLPERVGYLLISSLVRCEVHWELQGLSHNEIDAEVSFFHVCRRIPAERCVIAHSDVVALLLADQDYMILSEEPTNASSYACKGCNCGDQFCSMSHIRVNATALRRATQLVVQNVRWDAADMVLLCGGLWDLLKHQKKSRHERKKALGHCS
uniref:SET domain-containing protein n=1 Tax=Trypanosoma congolense (strain IL3000) TaxID=1068625 RepID=G0UU34_TRYCI|nr:conserved hypothetical protein [Trypanosoma congolense IL3000]